jgi:hypothetical protein
MLGTTFILSTNKNKVEIPIPPAFASVQVTRAQVIDSHHIFMIIDINPSYPYRVKKSTSHTLVVEGIIYNLSDKELFEKLETIANVSHHPEQANKLIYEFQDASDGEYIISIINNDTEAVVVFNDFFGRLPLFYYHDASSLFFSRDIKHMLQLIPQIKIDKAGMTDYLLFNYQLGTKTLFENVKQFDCKQILYGHLQPNQVQVSVFKKQLDLNLTTPYASRDACVSAAAEQLQEVTAIRNTKLLNEDYKLICDLSGGLDTRTVFGILSKLNKNVEYICHQITNDEATYANAVFSALHGPGKFTKVTVGNLISFEGNYIEELVYNTNAFVNYYSASICTRTLEDVFLKSQSPLQKTARFGGLGFTDFLRKGYRIDNKPLLESIENGYPGPLKLSEACQISGLNVKDYSDHLTALFNSWPEKKPEEQFKKLYFRYQIVLQSRYAEDRERLHFWNVQPMWNHKIVMDVLNRFPLKWRGPYTHTLLLNKIDKRLTSVPINHVHVQFDKMRKMKRMDLKDNSILYIKLKKLLKGQGKPIIASPQVDDKLAALLTDNYKQLQIFKNNINIKSAIGKYNQLGGDYNSATTLSIYFKVIEQQFRSKLKS